MINSQFSFHNDSKVLHANASHENAEPLTILLIDDNDDEAVLMYRVLENRNRKAYRLLHAKDGGYGLVLAQQKSPDVIISDLVMPDIDGFHVVETLRSNPHTCNIPIVISSARDIAPEERELLDQYVNMIYEKGTLNPLEFALRVIQVAKDKRQRN